MSQTANRAKYCGGEHFAARGELFSIEPTRAGR
jgi:hypothetical protein